MSIASELTALNGYILGAYDEINTKGGTVPTNKNMANLASAIGSISTGSSTTVTPLSVTENGTYTAPAGTAYSPVTVNVSGGGGGESLTIGDYNVLSGTFTPTVDANGVTVMPYEDFLAEVGGSVPANMFGGIFYPDTTATTAGFAFSFCKSSLKGTMQFSNGSSQQTTGLMNNTFAVMNVAFLGIQGVYFSAYNAKLGFKANTTYTWFVLWKN